MNNGLASTTRPLAVGVRGLPKWVTDLLPVLPETWMTVRGGAPTPGLHAGPPPTRCRGRRGRSASRGGSAGWALPPTHPVTATPPLLCGTPRMC